MSKPLSESDREKLRKVISVMRSATIEGERIAAALAAERIAQQNGLTLAEAEREAFPEEDDGRIDYDEREAQRRATEAWTANMVRMTNAYESAEKYRFMAAKEEARRRGLVDEPSRPERIGSRSSRTYIPTKQDEYRLIAGLLRDGVSLRRTAAILGIPTTEVARVWLLMRSKAA